MTELDRLITIAKAQVGVKEYPAGSNMVCYNQLYYGSPVALPWCVAFLWCIYMFAGLSHLFCGGKQCNGATTLYNYYKVEGDIKTAPQVGDIAIFNFSGKSGVWEHVGLVIDVDGYNIRTVEGNTSMSSDDNGGAVMLRTRNIQKTRTVFARIHYKEDTPTMTGEDIYNKLYQYLDDTAPPEYSKDDAQKAWDAGIINTVYPNRPLTRYQAAIVIGRMITLFDDMLSRNLNYIKDKSNQSDGEQGE